jgi:hypothetical protein
MFQSLTKMGVQDKWAVFQGQSQIPDPDDENCQIWIPNFGESVTHYTNVEFLGHVIDIVMEDLLVRQSVLVQVKRVNLTGDWYRISRHG